MPKFNRNVWTLFYWLILMKYTLQRPSSSNYMEMKTFRRLYEVMHIKGHWTLSWQISHNLSSTEMQNGGCEQNGDLSSIWVGTRNLPSRTMSCQKTMPTLYFSCTDILQMPYLDPPILANTSAVCISKQSPLMPYMKIYCRVWLVNINSPINFEKILFWVSKRLEQHKGAAGKSKALWFYVYFV